MPLYEYACKACGQHLEVSQSFKDEPLTTCPACGGPLRKVFNSIGISFKGSGFYRTDSRPALRKDREKDSEGASAGKGDKGSGGDKDKAAASGDSSTSSSTGSGDKAGKGDSGSSGDTSKSSSKSDSKPDAKSA